jgi:streptogramin lyase
MKRIVVGIALVLIAVAAANLLPSRAQQVTSGQQPPANGAPPPSNPLKVALLKWYPANLTTSFKVGTNPYGIAFDGPNVWVTNNGDGTVSKLRPSDGKVLLQRNVSNLPIQGLAFDGPISG